MSIEVKYNGVNLTNRFIVGDQNRPLPEFQVQTHSVDGADGELFGVQTIGPRYVSFRLTSTNKTPRQLQDEARFLMGLFAARRPKALTISDERDDSNLQLVRYAIPTGSFSMDEWIRSCSWVAQFVSPDPYLYGKQRSMVLPANTTCTFHTGGNAPANWTASVSSPSGTSYKIEYKCGSDSKRHVEVKAAFNDTYRLDIDSERMTAITGASGDGITTSSVLVPFHDYVETKATSATTLSWVERWL